MGSSTYVIALLLKYGADLHAPFTAQGCEATVVDYIGYSLERKAYLHAALANYGCYQAIAVLLSCRRRSSLLAQMPRDVLLIICRSIWATRADINWRIK